MLNVSFHSYIYEAFLQLGSIANTIQLFASNAGRKAAGEGVEHDAIGSTAVLDRVSTQSHWLRSWMEF